MVMRGSYMFESSVSEKKNNDNEGGGSREGSNTIMSNTNYQGIEN